MTMRAWTDILFLCLLAVFRFTGPRWLEALLLLGLSTGAFFLLFRESIKERSVYLAERILCLVSAWILPYHVALFHLLALLILTRILPPLRDRIRKKAWLILFPLLLLVLSAWLCHVWSTIPSALFRQVRDFVAVLNWQAPVPRQIQGFLTALVNQISFYRPSWKFTIPLFALSYAALDFGIRKGALRAPAGLSTLLLGQFLLLWISRVTDFAPHPFSYQLLSAFFIIVVTTFLFYLLDMVSRGDAWKIFLVQYGLFLAAGNRAFLVFLTVFSLIYLIRRAASEEGLLAGRAYQEYFERRTAILVSVPFGMALFFFFSHRSFSQIFLTLFTAAWIPVLADKFQHLSSARFVRRLHEGTLRLLPACLQKLCIPDVFFGLLTDAGIILASLFLVLINRLPFRVIAVYPLVWSIGRILEVLGERKRLRNPFEPGMFWRPFLTVLAVLSAEIFLFRR